MDGSSAKVIQQNFCMFSVLLLFPCNSIRQSREEEDVRNCSDPDVRLKTG